VATVAGSVIGGLTARMFAEATLQRLFAAVSLLAGAAMIGAANRRNVMPDGSLDTGQLGGRFFDDDSGRHVTYRIRRLPLALLASGAAGTVSSLLGVGGGVIKVPVLNVWCGVPLRAAAATSAFMIGVTATSAAVIYYGRGDLQPFLAAPAVVGVQLGSWAGLRFVRRVPVRWLKLLLAAVLFLVAALMSVRSAR
jgi:uncharacterized membrane protein YfcA